MDVDLVLTDGEAGLVGGAPGNSLNGDESGSTALRSALSSLSASSSHDSAVVVCFLGVVRLGSRLM